MDDENVRRTVNAILENSRQADSLVVCVGAQASRGAGVPDLRSLLREQKRTVSDLEGVTDRTSLSPALEDADLSELTELVQSRLSRDELIRLFVEASSRGTGPTSIHREVAALAPRAIVTTNFDSLLEQALRENGRTPRVFTTRSEASLENNTVPVFKLHGSIDDLSTLVLTGSDEVAAAEQNTSEDSLLRPIFATSLVIAVGFPVGSKELGALYERFGGAGGPRDWFVLATDGDPVAQALWRSRGVHVLRVRESEVPAVLNALRHRVRRTAGALPARDRHRVFISTSREELNLALAVQQFLRALGLRVVIWTDVPAYGRTIFEKFDELVASAEAAVVVIGPESQEPGASTRTHQNVLFELGYLMGKLGRDRVMVIATKAAEVPSDLAGTTFLVADPQREGMLQANLRTWATTSGLSK